MKKLNFSVFDWVCIAVTVLLVFNWHGFVKTVTQAGGEIATTGNIQGRNGSSFWRRLGQKALGLLPGGDIINFIWDEIWP